jgi:hypothetical protein
MIRGAAPGMLESTGALVAVPRFMVFLAAPATSIDLVSPGHPADNPMNHVNLCCSIKSYGFSGGIRVTDS